MLTITIKANVPAADAQGAALLRAFAHAFDDLGKRC